MLAALVAGLALRVFFLAATPITGPSVPGQLSAYNDELAHGRYILHLVQTGRLPGHVEAIDAPGALERGAYENYQPPLYYFLASGLCWAAGGTDLRDAVLAGRVLALLCAGFLVLIWLGLASTLSLDDAATAGGVIFIALNGVFVRFTATAGSEPLFWVFAGLLIGMAVRLRRSGGDRRDLLGFGLLAVVALYVKLTALLLLPLALLALLRHLHSRLVLRLLIMYAAILLLTLPLWWRNFTEFGSLLPLSSGFGAPAWRVPGMASVAYAVRSFLFPWSEFWRGLLGVALMLPAALYLLCGAVRRSGWRALYGDALLGGALLIALASFVWLNLRYDQAEARYLFSAWPAWTLLFVGRAPTNASLWVLVLVLLLPFLLLLLPAAGV